LATFSRQINAQAEEIRQQNLATFVAFGHLVNALSPLPGRKAVVYVSDGLPMRPGTELQEATQAAFRDLEIRDPATASSHDSRQAQIDQRSGALDVLSGSVPSRSRKGGRGSASPGQGPDGLLELTAMANAYQVSFYTLKPVSDYGGMAAEFDGDLGRLLTPQLQGVREQNLAETLEVLAGDTGGLSMRGTDIESVIDRARGDFRNHYSLGYTPAHEGDGRYHQIKLKVRGKKLRARYRGGYVDKSIEARIADRTTAALLLALDDNPHGIRLSTAAPEPAAENGQWVVPVEIEIPLAALTLVDRGEMMIGEAQLFVAVRGMDGRTAPVQAMDLRLEVPNSGEDPRGQSYTARFDLGMRSGVQRIAFGLLDPRTEVVSFVSKEVLVGVDR
jgi:VWFA-related protein